MAHRSTLRVLLAVATCLLAVVAVAARPAARVHAHAELIATTPAAAERLASPPPVIELRFTEAVDVVGDAIRLLDADGGEVEIGEVRADGSSVRAEVPELPDGGYVVDWHVVSADGHPIRGAFTFAVGDAELPTPPAGAGEEPGQGLAVPAARAATNAGLALVIGGAAFALWCWPDGRRHRGLARLLTGGATVALVAALVRIVAEAAALDASLDETISLRSGRAWVALAALAALGLAVAPVLRTPAGARLLGAGWLAYGVAVGLATAVGGHGASGRAPALGTALTVVHVIVACVWVGGLAALAVCVLGARDGTARRAALAFSATATTCLVVVVATGSAQGIRQVGGLDELTSTGYGRTLLVKIAVVAGLAVVAWWSRRVTHRSAGGDDTPLAASSLPRSLALECGLAVVVFAVTGWLAGEPPGSRTGDERPAPPTEQEFEATASVDGVNAAVRLAPAVAGSNRLEIVVITDDGRTPDEIDVRIEPADGEIAPIDVEVDAAGPGAVAGTVEVPDAGSWYVDLAARFGEFDLTELQVVVNVAPAG